MNCASKNFTMLFCSLPIFIHILIKRNPVRCLAVPKQFLIVYCAEILFVCVQLHLVTEKFTLSFSLIQPTLNQQYQIKNCYKIKMQHLHLLAYFSNTSLCHLVESLSTLHQNQPNVELMLTFNKSI